MLARSLRSRFSRYDLLNKNVLITGGSRGLGLALAREFASQGSRVTICARDLEELGRAKEQLARAGLQVRTAICDITQEASTTELIQELEASEGPLDVLVNNAGRIEVGPIETATTADFELAMATHFWGPLNLIKAVMPGMQHRRNGRIVNISSIGGKIGVPHLAAYDASKFALAGYSEALAAEVRKHNIFVTTVYPGLMRTGSPRNANFKSQHRKEYTWFTLSDSAPLITIGAARAARKIVNACRNGRASLTITPVAKVAALAHALAPDTVISALAMANRILPGPGGVGEANKKGRESQTLLTRSPLTLLDKRAAANLNQIVS
ncbi:MAG TPA: SDR family NAD(P)-dependent oxidoreductase [Candidatus Angelobacter sp.]|nr:SDR family NAD(P)-dependent oxidoreductase [Candidatus Angelobacter sp.]